MLFWHTTFVTVLGQVGGYDRDADHHSGAGGARGASVCSSGQTQGPNLRQQGMARPPTFVLKSSSYPQPPNFCTEAMIDCVMRTCMLAH